LQESCLGGRSWLLCFRRQVHCGGLDNLQCSRCFQSSTSWHLGGVCYAQELSCSSRGKTQHHGKVARVRTAIPTHCVSCIGISSVLCSHLT
jgi:hypothetical protein